MVIADIQADKVATYLGGKYSFMDSLLMGGTGSVRIVYQRGLLEFDKIASLNTDLPFCNFEMYRQGFSIRLIKKGQGQILGIRSSDIFEILFVTTPIRIRVRSRSVVRHKGVLIVKLSGCPVFFEVPQVYYVSFKRFLTKHLIGIVQWELCEAEDDAGGKVINLFSKFLKL
jgi:hypothetical protein